MDITIIILLNFAHMEMEFYYLNVLFLEIRSVFQFYAWYLF